MIEMRENRCDDIRKNEIERSGEDLQEEQSSSFSKPGEKTKPCGPKGDTNRPHDPYRAEEYNPWS